MANWGTGELGTLQDYLSDYRLTLRMKCEGLDAEQLACRCVPPSTMSLLGLLRHLAEMERDWRNWITPGHPLPKLYGERDTDFDDGIAVRELLAHRIEEYARHAGHADLSRGSANQPVAGCGSSGTITHWRQFAPA